MLPLTQYPGLGAGDRPGDGELLCTPGRDQRGASEFPRFHRLSWYNHTLLILLILFYSSSGTKTASTGHVVTGHQGVRCSQHLKSSGLPLNAMECAIFWRSSLRHMGSGESQRQDSRCSQKRWRSWKPRANVGTNPKSIA